MKVATYFLKPIWTLQCACFMCVLQISFQPQLLDHQQQQFLGALQHQLVQQPQVSKTDIHVMNETYFDIQAVGVSMLGREYKLSIVKVGKVLFKIRHN